MCKLVTEFAHVWVVGCCRYCRWHDLQAGLAQFLEPGTVQLGHSFVVSLMPPFSSTPPHCILCAWHSQFVTHAPPRCSVLQRAPTSSY
jgi:hypothetical protein